MSLARDEVSGDEVVLRALPSEVIADTATLERLERETSRLSGLHHEGIVSSYELCWLRGPGKVFLVSEHINGQTLRELLASNRECFRDEKHFRTLAEQISSAIDYAHQRKITHRDLTSDNVLLTLDNRIKIVDFGIDAVISEFHLETRKKRSWATRRLSSSGKDVERSIPIDIYSLGKLFHEMLLGESHPLKHARRRSSCLSLAFLSALTCLSSVVSTRRYPSVQKALERFSICFWKTDLCHRSRSTILSPTCELGSSLWWERQRKRPHPCRRISRKALVESRADRVDPTLAGDAISVAMDTVRRRTHRPRGRSRGAACFGSRAFSKRAGTVWFPSPRGVSGLWGGGGRGVRGSKPRNPGQLYSASRSVRSQPVSSKPYFPTQGEGL